MTDLPIVKVPGDEFISTAHWLHGEPLKRWYEARERVLAQFTGVLGSHPFGPDGGGE